jgi:hypothetical protein
MQSSLIKAHRVLAVGLGLFIISHLAIHLSAIAGPETHISILSNVQGLYRNWLVEPLLYLAIFLQVFIGGKLVWRRYRQPQKRFWGWAQILSGGYLAMFMVVHSLAALVTRYIFDVDTDFYWAAGTLNIEPLQYIFAPYYMLGIISVFAHLGAAIHFGWGTRGRRYSWLLIVVGSVIASLIVAAFSGAFYDIELPPEVIEMFNKYIPN